MSACQRCNQSIDSANTLYSPGGDLVCTACHQDYLLAEKRSGDSQYFFRRDAGSSLGSVGRTVAVCVIGGASLGAAISAPIYRALLPGPHGGLGGGPAGAVLGFLAGACLGTGFAAQTLHARRGGELPARVHRLVTGTRIAAIVIGVLPLVSALAS